MWKSTDHAPPELPGPVMPASSSSSAQARALPAQPLQDKAPTPVKIRIMRPDGSHRDIKVAGHFREEHLCSLVDDELCRLENDETLIIHLFHTDVQLSRSLRSRWEEGLSDNRQVFVREVLGPTGDPHQVAVQMRDVRRRLATGEHVNLAIRSPEVAQLVRKQLRKLLLISQRSEEPPLHVWVHGDDQAQEQILGQLENIGVVRVKDYEQFIDQHHDRRWRVPSLDADLKRRMAQPKHRRRRRKSQEQEVNAWIRRVEHEREQPQS